ncbi:hypothetical protein MUU74_04580 [Chryseobacterium daecheongense]|uniref:hypothetical protein n=1 Tax=Chryseobacterium daecheongense TaxID=192389 RepID=UPI001FD6B0A9|nr:hypothetical protein [Chryseobacterium daecheongense]UOU99237.1 hypothetical protein MUU74_04580 [Chryseobacterium daecheongense]
MKKILILFLPLIIMGVTISCSSAQIKNPHIQREWMLISYEGFTKEQLIKNKAGINLTAEKKKVRSVAERLWDVIKCFLLRNLKAMEK